ncbi:hypothetical protein SAMN05216260_106299 [Streptomyces griseoaurantiacus]|jgi:hypothetical protein|uniref:Uncharacterized protein n=1 Tax=Streptomyces griseoaurantiacus TaxID=68213 RepID=A0A1G7J5H5_9ACTN|nr:hypothetical protein SAMN05216260_106299 [Streptomyces jietaisiensis]
MSTRPRKSIVLTDLSAAVSTQHTAMLARPDADVLTGPQPSDAPLLRRKGFLLRGCIRGSDPGVDTAVPGMPEQHDHASTVVPGVRLTGAEGVGRVLLV